MASEARIREIFEMCDADGDGMLSVMELKELLKHLSMDNASVYAIMGKVDTNEDGHVSFDEFLHWVFSNGVEMPPDDGNQAYDNNEWQENLQENAPASIHGCVLWCDCDIKVESSATAFKEAGLEVRAFHTPEELLEEYEQRLHEHFATDVVAVVSSMMESGGRKEEGLMNAFDLFAACRAAVYAAGRRVPVFGVISMSADPELAYAHGADVCVLGNRAQMQERVLMKLSHWSVLAGTVLWCDTNSRVSKMEPVYQESGQTLVTFTETDDWIEYLMSESGATVTAVITSSMTSGGRIERGGLSGFEGFAKARRLLDGSSRRPIFAIVSGRTYKTADAYSSGADVAICKDNVEWKARYPDGSMWDNLSNDVLSILKRRPRLAGVSDIATKVSEGRVAVKRVRAMPMVFPKYWDTKSTEKAFSEMVPVDLDSALGKAVEAAMIETFKRADDGFALSTRDRKEGEKPMNFRVAQVYRVEDSHLWQRYAACRAAKAADRGQPFEDIAHPPLTSGVFGLPPCMEEANEAFLFHGTNPEAAQGIIHTGFRIDLAGTAVGCAFGKGAYLAEASTKSDEYSRPGEGIFSQLYAMLLCRVSLGCTVRVEDFYWESDQTKHIVDKDILQDHAYHCLLGDREAKRGTYREFIVFEREQIYPEFVILYHRDC
eukprot:TRINITY_DN32781_c0_g1_i1.p1 TRINITY_DN32781_c0_g1~~TRINITY_DN32781_c0_g1_i1.p1  ORF type:complete len:660 (-),score=117.74 TRINITY_DN32781_c0_g1_i1:181-2160(-)